MSTFQWVLCFLQKNPGNKNTSFYDRTLLCLRTRQNRYTYTSNAPTNPYVEAISIEESWHSPPLVTPLCGEGAKITPAKFLSLPLGKKKICRAMLFMILTFCASHSQFLRPCTECIQIMVRMLSLHFDSAYKYSKNRCSLETRSPRAASDFALDILLWYCSYSGGCPKSDGEYILWFKLGNSCDIHSAKEPEVPKAGRCVGLFIVDLLGL